MCRWRAAAVGVACFGLPGVVLVLLGSSPAGASGVSVHVTPTRGLVDGQTVTVSGHGLARTYAGKPLTWFLAECTATVQGRMNPSKDTPHCDVTEAKAIRLSSRDTFSAPLQGRDGHRRRWLLRLERPRHLRHQHRQRPRPGDRRPYHLP